MLGKASSLQGISPGWKRRVSSVSVPAPNSGRGSDSREKNMDLAGMDDVDHGEQRADFHPGQGLLPGFPQRGLGQGLTQFP